MTKFSLSSEDIINLAHHVIQAMQCEWEECPITLNSWDTLAKHLLRHGSRAVPQDGVYHCCYSRCSGRLHNSSAALKTHIELSHLSRVTLQCPARNCKEEFVRVQQLSSHFEHAHRELLDKSVSVDAFAPLALLAPPRHLRRPASLPRNETRTEFFLPSVSMPPIRQGHSQASSSQSLSRKWSRLNVQDEESGGNPIAFNDLPSLEPENIVRPPAVDIEVRGGLPLARQPHLSRPQPAIYPVRFHEPEQTTLYSAFERMVTKLVESGALAAHKEGGE